ncbi:MAG: conjugal transfer protein TraH [Thermodesulfovibrionales bacterium]
MFQKWGFRATSTEPGVYNAQTRGFIAGGSLNVRARSMDLPPLVSINPPHIKAGCGGIDLFFGGIDFINTEELKNMAVSIGQNALGYAFQLGLEAVCPSCNETIKNLTSEIRKMQSMASDSCSAAKSLVNWAAGSQIEGFIADCISEKVDAGKSYQEARSACVAGRSSMTEVFDERQRARDEGRITKGPSVGCDICEALRFSGLSDDDKLLAVNVVGAVVRTARKDDPNGISVPVPVYYAPKLTFKDFMIGKTGAEVWKPRSNADGIDDMEITTMDIPSYRTKTLATVTAIADKISNQQPLTEDEKNFINASIVPIQPLIKSASKTPGLLDATLDIVTDMAVIGMSVQTVNKYILAVEQVLHRQTVTPPQEFFDRIAKLKEETHNEFIKEMKYFEGRMKVYELTAFFLEQMNKMSRFSVAQKQK